MDRPIAFAEDLMSRLGAKLVFLYAAMAGLAVAQPAVADTIVHKTITYFSIGGTTAADLDHEMMTRGPISSVTGRRHPGATRIKFSGNATFIGKNGRCRIGGAKVTLSTRIMLPRWSNRRKATPQLGLIWDTLASDIRRHEERHAEIARNHARDFEKQILALPSASSCAILKAKVGEITRQAMEDHDKDQKRFDKIEAVNFENRMIRLLKYRITAKRAL
jgi:predicted secreted Zn-dependent protease